MKQDSKTSQSYHHFTEKEKQFIKYWYPLKPNEWIANYLGLTTKQISNYALRNAAERWVKKSSDCLMNIRTGAGRKGGRPRKK